MKRPLSVKTFKVFLVIISERPDCVNHFIGPSLQYPLDGLSFFGIQAFSFCVVSSMRLIGSLLLRLFAFKPAVCRMHPDGLF
jgi:hypothetical protein